MSSSGVAIADECVTTFNELKLKKAHKYIIYKLSDDYKEIVIEETSSDKDYENFREKLINAQSANKAGKLGPGPRYAVYDFEYELSSGEGARSKIAFIAWSPDDSAIQPKMIYASSKERLRLSLPGLAVEIQANDTDDLEYSTVLNNITKGKH